MTIQTAYKLTDRQKQALALIRQGAPHVQLQGGSRSGKTFLLLLVLVLRALKASGSRHLVCRRHFSSAKTSIWLDTLPKVIHCFPGLPVEWNETDHYLSFPNDSELWVDGLDDKERVDKILGREYATIYYNETSEIRYASVETARTRLSQAAEGIAPRAFYDLNPVTEAHWSHKLFFEHVDPVTEEPLPHPDQYAQMQLNPGDNQANLAPGYIETQLASLTGARRKRFFEGLYGATSELLAFPLPKRGSYEWPEFEAWLKKIGAVNVRLTAGLDLGFDDADGFVIIAYAVKSDPTRWIIYEYKARREGLQELADAVRRGLAFVRKLELPHGDLDVFTDSGGGGKKSWADLHSVYGLPVRRAYKHEKNTAVELLHDDVVEGRMRVPKDGAFEKECRRTVWQRNPDTDEIIRIIDDDAYHPDLADAILYAMRPVWYYYSNPNGTLPNPEKAA